jgi:hypothetical protein
VGSARPVLGGEGVGKYLNGLVPAKKSGKLGLLIGHRFALVAAGVALLGFDHSATFAAAQTTNPSVVDGSQHRTNADKKDVLDLLTKLAEEGVNQDKEFLGKTRFAILQADRSFSYNLDPIPASDVLSGTDPYGTPLEALIRVESLRRDFQASVPAEDFWILPLEKVHQTVKDCVQKLEASQPKLDPREAEQSCSNSIAEQFKQLETAIQKYGSAHGLALVRSQTRDPVVGYRVHIKIEPPKAHVRVMTALDFKKYSYFNTPKDQYQWNDLLEAESLMIGRYHYRAEWPQDLNGPDEGDFEIKSSGTITFTPKSK